jgi:hypothetical protein
VQSRSFAGCIFAAPETIIRDAKKPLRHGVDIDYSARLTALADGSYPLQGVPKNIASLITYPHSETQRLKKRLCGKQTYIFCEFFLGVSDIYDTRDSLR